MKTRIIWFSKDSCLAHHDERLNYAAIRKQVVGNLYQMNKPL